MSLVFLLFVFFPFSFFFSSLAAVCLKHLDTSDYFMHMIVHYVLRNKQIQRQKASIHSDILHIKATQVFVVASLHSVFEIQMQNGNGTKVTKVLFLVVCVLYKSHVMWMVRRARKSYNIQYNCSHANYTFHSFESGARNERGKKKCTKLRPSAWIEPHSCLFSLCEKPNHGSVCVWKREQRERDYCTTSFS